MDGYEPLRLSLIDGLVLQCETFGQDLKRLLAEQSALRSETSVPTDTPVQNDRNTGRCTSISGAQRRQTQTANDNDDVVTKSPTYVDKGTSTEICDMEDRQGPIGEEHLTSTSDVDSTTRNMDGQSLSEKYDDLYRKYERMRRQAGVYKASFREYKHNYENYKVAYEDLREKYQRGKLNIKEWQNFVDRSRAKSTPGVRPGIDRMCQSPTPPLHPQRSIEQDAEESFTHLIQGDHTGIEITKGPVQLPITPISEDHEVQETRAKSNQNGIVLSENVPPELGWRSIAPSASKSCTTSVQEFATLSKNTDNIVKNNYNEDVMLPQVSSQTTDDESQGNTSPSGIPTLLDRDSNSDPVVVSERVLKRKRPTENWGTVRRRKKPLPLSQDGSTRKPIKIKDELLSSSPLAPAGKQGLSHEQSLDLDDVTGFVMTPKKNKARKEREKALKRINSFRRSQGDPRESADNRATSAPLGLEDTNTSPHIVPSRISKSFEHNSLQNEEDAEMLLREDSYVPLAAIESQEQRNFDGLGETDHESKALRPKSVNEQLPKRLHGKGSRILKGGIRKDQELAELAEDGDQYVRADTGSNIGQLAASRISNLLEEGRTEKLMSKSPLIKYSHAQRGIPDHRTTPKMHHTMKNEIGSVHSARRSPHSEPVAKTHPLRLPASTPITKSRPSLVGHLPECSDTPQPEQEPLRARPVSRLNLDSFKVNPKANSGYKYAFNSVVRNQAARACLPGCTRPSCCGGVFEKAIELGGALPPPKRGLWDDSQDDDEELLLKQYLGCDRNRILTMNAQERAKMLSKARAAQLAQMAGRHRQSYQRQLSPPGFWRAEMPSTQETEMDRQRAKEMERQKVEERYMEAMRPGGQWIFADE